MAGINPKTGMFDVNYNAQASAMSSSIPSLNTATDTSLANMNSWNQGASTNAGVGSAYSASLGDQASSTGSFDALGMTGDTSGSGGAGTNFLGKDGWGNTAMAGATSLANSWLGFEQLGVAKDQYALEKEQYEYNKTNYDDALQRKASALANS